MKQLTTQASLIQELNSALKSIQPSNSELTQIITYTLLATAIVGIAVYHYIKNSEENPINSIKENN